LYPLLYLEYLLLLSKLGFLWSLLRLLGCLWLLTKLESLSCLLRWSRSLCSLSYRVPLFSLKALRGLQFPSSWTPMSILIIHMSTFLCKEVFINLFFQFEGSNSKPSLSNEVHNKHFPSFLVPSWILKRFLKVSYFPFSNFLFHL